MSTGSNHTSEELWKQVQQGDTKAFELLYRKAVLSLTNQAYKIIKDEDLTKDIVQDVFVSLYMRRLELPEDMNIMGYLSNAVKYKVSTHLRDKLSKEPHHLTLLKQQQLAELSQSDPYERSELRKRIQSGIDALPEKCRQAFIMSHFDSLPYKDIARQMGISVKTVEKHISKALQVLRQELKEEHAVSAVVLMTILLST